MCYCRANENGIFYKRRIGLGAEFVENQKASAEKRERTRGGERRIMVKRCVQRGAEMPTGTTAKAHFFSLLSIVYTVLRARTLVQKEKWYGTRPNCV